MTNAERAEEIAGCDCYCDDVEDPPCLPCEILAALDAAEARGAEDVTPAEWTDALKTFDGWPGVVNRVLAKRRAAIRGRAR